MSLTRPTVVHDLFPRLPGKVRDYIVDLEEQLRRVPPLQLFPNGPPPPQPADTDRPPDQNQLGRFRKGSSDTARKAALDNYPRSGRQRHTILVALVGAGEHGLTSDEIARTHRMNLYSVKPRLIELREGGWARQNGEQRKSQQGSDVDVYVATLKAYDEARTRGEA